MSKQLPYYVDPSVGQAMRMRAIERELHELRVALRLIADALERTGERETARQLRALLGLTVAAASVREEVRP